MAKEKKVKTTSTETEIDAKTESLNKTLSEIRKQYGNGAIMRMDESTAEDVEVIPTGSIGLDRALGVGGIPRGRIIEVYGPEAGGKCLTADTYIQTQDGVQTIKEIFEKHNVVPSCTTKNTRKEYKLVNINGNLENTKTFTNNGRRNIIKIKTKSGNVVKSTYNHPWLVMNEYGYNVWRKTDNLQKGDYLIQNRKYDSLVNTKNIREEFYMLGLLLADGCFDKNRISITNDDPDIRRFIENNMSACLGIAYKKYDRPENNTTDYHFNSKEKVELFYNTYNYKKCIAKEKYISNKIRSAGREAIRSFIMGFVDCESYISKNDIEITSASYTLLFELKMLLSYFGIVSILKDKTVKGYEHNDYYRLAINGNNAILYRDIVGSNSEKITARLSLIDAGDYRDNVPNIKHILTSLVQSVNSDRDLYSIAGEYLTTGRGQEVPYRVLSKVLDWCNKHNESTSPIIDYVKKLVSDNYYYDEILSIDNDVAEPTFDFEMSETHSFIANGIVSHNTTLALQILAEAQKLGGTVAFIDAEHALDLAYAQKLGVDPSKLFLTQPDSGEQGLEITESLVRSGAIDIVVIDSVAALVPAAELAGEMGDAQMGLQARLMSQALRKLTAITSKTNTTVLFINQLRTKFNVSFGSPEITSGGNALKFYASVRLDVRRISSIKEDDVPIGNRVKVKVVKNKVSPPFRECEFDLLFGKGINKLGELVDLSENYGIIEKSGAWYKYKEENIGHGRDKTIEFLEANESIRLEIEKRLKEIK